MKQARTIGNNIKMLLQEKGLSYKDLAEKLGFTELEIAKICDGRLMVTDQDLYEIAETLNVDTDFLLEEQPKERYCGNLFVHYMHTFNEEKNEQMILDIFDFYCDMKEAIAMNE